MVFLHEQHDPRQRGSDGGFRTAWRIEQTSKCVSLKRCDDEDGSFFKMTVWDGLKTKYVVRRQSRWQRRELKQKLS